MSYIDINPRRGSSKPSKKDDLNRWVMKNLRIKYALLYKDRWEIERVNANLKSTHTFSPLKMCIKFHIGTINSQ